MCCMGNCQSPIKKKKNSTQACTLKRKLQCHLTAAARHIKQHLLVIRQTVFSFYHHQPVAECKTLLEQIYHRYIHIAFTLGSSQNY